MQKNIIFVLLALLCVSYVKPSSFNPSISRTSKDHLLTVLENASIKKSTQEPLKKSVEKALEAYIAVNQEFTKELVAGNTARCEDLMRHNLFLKNYADNDGNSHIHMAARYHNHSLLLGLCKRGAFVCGFNKEGVRPIFYACQSGCLTCLEHFNAQSKQSNHTLNYIAKQKESERFSVFACCAQALQPYAINYILQESRLHVGSAPTLNTTPLFLALSYPRVFDGPCPDNVFGSIVAILYQIIEKGVFELPSLFGETRFKAEIRNNYTLSQQKDLFTLFRYMYDQHEKGKQVVLKKPNEITSPFHPYLGDLPRSALLAITEALKKECDTPVQPPHIEPLDPYEKLACTIKNLIETHNHAALNRRLNSLNEDRKGKLFLYKDELGKRVVFDCLNRTFCRECYNTLKNNGYSFNIIADYITAERPIHFAAKKCSLEMLNYLVESGVHCTHITSNYKSALHLLLSCNSPLLLGNPLVEKARFRTILKMVRILIANNVDPKKKHPADKLHISAVDLAKSLYVGTQKDELLKAMHENT